MIRKYLDVATEADSRASAPVGPKRSYITVSIAT